MNIESQWEYPNNKDKNWISYRDSIEFKRGLRELEECPGMHLQSKVIILAVALNLKKAGEFDFNTQYVSSDSIEGMLSDLGIYFFKDSLREKQEIKYNHDYHLGCYIIGSTPNSIGEAMEAMEKRVSTHVDDAYHRQFGEAMEFPPTAVEAFSEYMKKDDSSQLIDASADVRLTDEEKAFLFFRLSSDNWEEEIQWLEQIIAGVKEYSPNIYNEVMSSYIKKKSVS